MGEYGYGVDQLMAEMFGQYTDGSKGSKALQSGQASGVNNVQDLLKLLLDPQLAMYSGSYDPSLLAPQQAQTLPFQEELSRTTGWMNSGIPGVADVAAGFISGQMDPATANAMIKDAATQGLVPGVDVTKDGWEKDVSNYVSEMWDEVNKNTQARTQYETQAAQSQLDAQNAPRDDVFSKAGLPSPTEQYTADTVPMDSEFYGNYQQAQEKSSATQKALDEYMAKNPAVPVGPMAKPEAAHRPTSQTVEAPKDPNAPTFANSGAGKTLDWFTNEDSLVGQMGGYNPDKESFVGQLLDPFKGEDLPSLSTAMAGQIADAVNGGRTPNGSTSRAAAQSRAQLDRSKAFMQAISGDGDVAKKAQAAKKNGLVASNTVARNATSGYEADAKGEAAAMRRNGRSPLNDALQARMAMLRQMGIV